jgi:hypothetical protein
VKESSNDTITNDHPYNEANNVAVLTKLEELHIDKKEYNDAKFSSQQVQFSELRSNVERCLTNYGTNM